MLFRNLLVVSSAWLARGDSSAEVPKVEEKLSAVQTLTSKNFGETLEASKYVLVKFYAPWCGHCKAMAPDYIKAAEQLKEIEPSVVLAEVDADEEKELAQQYGVSGYPTLYWFVSGNKREFTGQRTAEGIIEWIQKNMGPALKEWTAEELKTALEARLPYDAIFTFTGDDSMKEIANKIAEEGKHVAQIGYMKGDSNTVRVYRGHGEEDELASVNAEEVEKWVGENRAPYFGQINEENFEIYVEYAKKGIFWVCLDPKTRDADLKTMAPALVESAKEQSAEEKYPFVWLDIAEFEAHAKEELGCTSFPTIVLQRGDLLGDREDTKVERFLRSFADNKEELSKASAVTQFFADVKSGALEAVPEPDELAELDDEDEEDGEEQTEKSEEEL